MLHWKHRVNTVYGLAMNVLNELYIYSGFSYQQNMQTDGVLTRGAFGWSGDGNFTSLCPNGTKWVWDVFGECAQDGRDMASIYLGLLSILCFMVSSFP